MRAPIVISNRLQTLKSQTYHSNQTPNKQRTSKLLRLNSFVVLYLAEPRQGHICCQGSKFASSQFRDNWIYREKRSSSTVYSLHSWLSKVLSDHSTICSSLARIKVVHAEKLHQLTNTQITLTESQGTQTRCLIADKPSSSCLS